jgi:hypothetical protein
VRIEVKMRREIENRKTILCNPLHKVDSGICYKRSREKPWRVAKGRNEKLLRFHNNPAKEILVKTEATFCFKMKHAQRKRMRKWAANCETDSRFQREWHGAGPQRGNSCLLADYAAPTSPLLANGEAIQADKMTG